jgi:hypothetical protein
LQIEGEVHLLILHSAMLFMRRPKMIEILEVVEKQLPDLLADEAAWSTLYIDYHPPLVERVWRQWGEYRICLHRIHPCRPEEALFHPHPWPSAMRIISGRYNMGVGHGPGIKAPPIDKALEMTAGAAYEMAVKTTGIMYSPSAMRR